MTSIESTATGRARTASSTGTSTRSGPGAGGAARPSRRRAAGVLALAGALALTAPGTATAEPPGEGTGEGPVSRVSLGPDGQQANQASWVQQQVPSISADGNVVVFASMASNLVPGDTNETDDVFVHDRRTGTTTRVSVSSSGAQAGGGSTDPSISADGRRVAFMSIADDLVRGDTNGLPDVFVHDLDTGRTTRVSVGRWWRQADGPSFAPTISADGSTVAFASHATNLSGRWAQDTNGQEDVYVRDLRRHRTTRVSVTPEGGQFTGPSAQAALSGDGQQVAFVAEHGGPNEFEVWVHDRRTRTTTLVSVPEGAPEEENSVSRPVLSADGRFVAFDSARTSLVPGDSGATRDVFVRDLLTGTFTRVSAPAGGGEADGDSHGPSLSADGRYVAFASAAEDLAPGDGNGLVDVFLADTATGDVRLVSHTPAGRSGDWHSAYYGELAVSADGRHVVFESGARDLVAGDTNAWPDVFVWDRTGDGGPVRS